MTVHLRGNAPEASAARWTHGRTLIWVGRQKTASRGEGGSNLVFDRSNDLQQKKE